MLALLCCILMCTGVVYATGDDTDGTELQVAQPVILEVQLGPQWAGVEFQLKTDAGLYPGTIAVGQDGILRTELGNSGSYVLSCLTLNRNRFVERSTRKSLDLCRFSRVRKRKNL